MTPDHWAVERAERMVAWCDCYNLERGAEALNYLTDAARRERDAILEIMDDSGALTPECIYIVKLLRDAIAARGGGMMPREEVLQAVLDKLWSSAHEFGADVNEHGNPKPEALERWQVYAEQLMLRWLEYHSPSAAERAKARS